MKARHVSRGSQQMARAYQGHLWRRRLLALGVHLWARAFHDDECVFTARHAKVSENVIAECRKNEFYCQRYRRQFRSQLRMDKILRGVMKYRHNVRAEMVDQFVRVRDNPVPTAIFFCCVDSRMLPTRFTQTNVGDMFIVRNAGNLIPHMALFRDDTVSTEPAALELGCVLNRVQHIIVCGHSDCKAMNMLYDLRDSEAASLTNQRLSPMKAWLCRYGHSSLQRFEDFNRLGWDHPMTFLAETPMKRFIAYIDPVNRFNITDKLSQFVKMKLKTLPTAILMISCLQQVQNIASYPFLKKGLENGLIRIHAMWFDIYTGDIFFFSRRRKLFVEINEDTINMLLKDIES